MKSKLKKIKLRIYISKIIRISLCTFAYFTISSQNSVRVIDSLTKLLNTNNFDTTYVNNLIVLSKQYYSISNFNKSFKIAKQAENIAKKANYKKGILNANINYATIYIYRGDFDSALFISNEILKTKEFSTYVSEIATVYNTLGYIHSTKGDFKQGLICYMKSLKTHEKLNAKKAMTSLYNNIGAVYIHLGKYNIGLSYFFKSLKLCQEINLLPGIAGAYNNIGSTYLDYNEPEKSLYYITKSIEIKQKIGDVNGTANSLINLGSIYKRLLKFEDALKNYKKALVIKKKIGDKKGIYESYFNVGSIFISLSEINKANQYLDSALKMAALNTDKIVMRNCYIALTEVNEVKSNFKQALNYQKLYTSINDSLFNIESNKQITEMNTKYETELKDKELIKKDSEIKMQQANSEKQTIIRNGFIIGFIFLLGLIVFVYRGYIQKQKINKLLNDKNQKITDSINYAKLIQSSILPSQSEVQKYLPNSFVYYQPKDIVSGDFYWMYPINEQIVLFAVVDCTGHGVPGAMMSMLGYSLLEQIINQNKTTQPAQILDELHYLVIESLKQSGNVDSVKNGMDMALFKLNYTTYELEYAGAKNPLYIIRDNKVNELKADRKSIGLSTANNNPFTNQVFKLQPNDQVYAFSDGYIDQKGGAENKKFYSANFQKLLISISTLNTDEQAEQIKNTFLNWKGSKDQMDDVSVFGVIV